MSEAGTQVVFVPLSEVERAEIGCWPGTLYEGWVRDLLGRGWRVPWHPSACASPECGHAKIWHKHGTRYRVCEVQGCTCRLFVSQRATSVPASAPEAVPTVARGDEDEVARAS